MTKREMIEAMLEGKTLESVGAIDAIFSVKEDDFIVVMPNGLYQIMQSEDFDQFPWRIKPSPEMRPMTRNEVLGFLANTPGIVVRFGSEPWRVPGGYALNQGLERCFWATISPEGIIGEAKRFVKEVEA